MFSFSLLSFLNFWPTSKNNFPKTLKKFSQIFIYLNFFSFKNFENLVLKTIRRCTNNSLLKYSLILIFMTQRHHVLLFTWKNCYKILQYMFPRDSQWACMESFGVASSKLLVHTCNILYNICVISICLEQNFTIWKMQIKQPNAVISNNDGICMRVH